jgi:hypothetical protein
MNNNKETVTELLSSTGRRGVDGLIEYLVDGCDFFEAPASTKYHSAYTGGLAEHSLSVYNTLKRLDGAFASVYPADQIIITGLLHDLCKTSYYVPETAWRKDDHGKWESYTRWGVDDILPLGHGEKSLYLVSKFIDLSAEEAAAIRWHMGAWADGVTTSYAAGQSYNAAVGKYPLVTLLSTADNISSHLVE